MELVARRVSVVIPALNEEETIGGLLAEMPWGAIRECIVADNGSTDRTAEVARAGGAVVVHVPERGYGRACAGGLAHTSPESDVLVFMDGDGSDIPAARALRAGPLRAGQY